MGFGKGMHNLNPAGALLTGNYTEGTGADAVVDTLRPEFRTRERTFVVLPGDGAAYTGFTIAASFNDGDLFGTVLDVWQNEVTDFGAHGGHFVFGADYPLIKVTGNGGDETSSFKVFIV